jgi:hypothetical protein
LEKIDVPGSAMDALAGLVRCELGLGELAHAREHNQILWNFLAAKQGEGMEFLVLAYQTAADVFAANGEDEQAQQVRKEGYEGLMAMAEKISDERWRKSFLENIPEHISILVAAN